MIEWLIPIAFWTAGLIVMSGGEIVNKQLGKKRSEMAEHSKSARYSNTKESMYYAIEENALDMMPGFVVRIIAVITGMIIIVLGFVALSLIL